MAWYEFLFHLGSLNERQSALIWASIFWAIGVLLLVIIWIATSRSSKKGIDVSALATLASSDASVEGTAPNADPKEVMAILSIERVAASTALSAVKDASKNRRIGSKVAGTLTNRYKARIAKIDADLKRRSGAQEYQSLAQSLEQSRDRLRGEIMPKAPTAPAAPARSGLPPPPPSSTPGIPSTAPPVPGVPSSGPPRSSGIPSIPSVPKGPATGPPSMGTPPTRAASPIPTPPKIPTVGPSSARPTTVVPPSVAPPTISTPPLPPRAPTAPTAAPTVAPPTTGNLAPPPVPTAVSAPTAPAVAAAPTGDSDTQSISGLRMEMLRELARLKKFMSEETQ